MIDKIPALKQVLAILTPSILAQYLMRNIAVLCLAVFTIISLVVFGNQLVLVIKESLKEGLPVVDLFPLIGLKMIRDVPLILSLSLFLAIILSVNKLYKDSEAVVMNAIGVGDKRLISFIQPIIILTFLLVLFLTTVIVPWSKQQRSLIMAQAQNASEFSFIKQGEFQEFKNGELIFYASEVTDAGNIEQAAALVFIYALVNSEPIVTLAKQAQKYTDKDTGSVYLRLKNGSRYHGFPSSANKKILDFDVYDLQIIDSKAQKSVTHTTKIDAKNTGDLMRSNHTQEAAELQWRLSQPLSILILSALGVLLGKASPRGGKNLGVLIGVVVFILYNNLMLVAKSAIEKGNLSETMGLWWVHLLVLLFVWIFYTHRTGKINLFFRSLRKAHVK